MGSISKNLMKIVAARHFDFRKDSESPMRKNTIFVQLQNLPYKLQ